MQEHNFELSRILWIGGGTDAGKTTVATILAERSNFQVYHFDRSSGAAARLGRGKAPRTFEWMDMSDNERWLLRSPEEIARHTFETFAETFSVKLAEIVEMTKPSPVIAEGFAFTPKLVAPLISSVHQAIWLIPTEEFKRDSFQRRGKENYRVRDGSSDPIAATENFIPRDLLMASQMRRDADAKGLKVLEIDGSLSPDVVASSVETHFAPYLATIQERSLIWADK